MPAGRPSKYDPKFCEEIIQYFSIEPYKEVDEVLKYKNGDEKIFHKEIPNDLPLFSEFARKIGVNQDSLHEWCKVHTEFSEAFKISKGLQEKFLVTNALRNNFNCVFSIFTAKNIFGWRDQQTLAISGYLEQNEIESERKDRYSKNSKMLLEMIKNTNNEYELENVQVEKVENSK